MDFASMAEQRRYRKLREPNLAECVVTNRATDTCGIIAWCETHRRQAAICEQLVQGNMCSLCHEWHSRDITCQVAQDRIKELMK